MPCLGNKPGYPTTIVQCEGRNKPEQFRLHPDNASLVRISWLMQAQVSRTVPGYSRLHRDRKIRMPRQR